MIFLFYISKVEVKTFVLLKRTDQDQPEVVLQNYGTKK